MLQDAVFRRRFDYLHDNQSRSMTTLTQERGDRGPAIQPLAQQRGPSRHRTNELQGRLQRLRHCIADRQRRGESW